MISDERYQDGHDPSTCNYQACNATAARGPCPFVKDEPSLSDSLRQASAAMRQMELEQKAALFDELQDVLRRILEHDSGDMT